MPRAYSEDLRLKVLGALERGKRPAEAAADFGISVSVIYKWQQRQRTTGDVSARRRGGSGYGHKLSDLDAFRAYVDANADLTLTEMGAELGVGKSTVHRALQKIGYTHKKRVSGTGSRIRPLWKRSGPALSTKTPPR
jgi:transposase